MSETIINQCNSGHSFVIQGENILGDSVTVYVTPKIGYTFVSWEDGRTDNPRTFDIRECGKHYVAIFETSEEEQNCVYEDIYKELYILLGEGLNPNDYDNLKDTISSCDEIFLKLNEIIE